LGQVEYIFQVTENVDDRNRERLGRGYE